jgi:hypothetical protein
MRELWVVAPLVLCGCLRSMVRAPKQIPADGNVVCTDTMGTPIASALGSAVSGGAFAFSLTRLDYATDHGGIYWVPLLGSLSLELLFVAGTGHWYATECRAAKRQGAEIAERARRRREANLLWKRAEAAKRADDCATVRELDPQILALDRDFHAAVFARDWVIARCLATP